MGYYSDVLIAVAAACKDDLQAIVAKAKVEDPIGYEKTKLILAEAKLTQLATGAFLWVHLTSVKWYEEYPGPKFFQTLLRAADSMDWPSLFVRIGEEHDDIEYEMCEPFADDLTDERFALNEDLVSAMYTMFSVARQIEREVNDKVTVPWRP